MSLRRATIVACNECAPPLTRGNTGSRSIAARDLALGGGKALMYHKN